MARKRARTSAGSPAASSPASKGSASLTGVAVPADEVGVGVVTGGEAATEELEQQEAQEEEEKGGEGESDSSEQEDDDEDGMAVDDDDDGDDDDSDSGTVPDFRKRLRRQRDKDRVATAAAANGGTPATAAAATAAAAAAAEEEGGEGRAEGSSVMEFASDGTYRNKQRVLLFSSRGITSRFRHLLGDLRKLIPHHKKDVKLDVGRDESLSSAVNEIAEIKSCNSCVFLECRKKTDLYLWAGKTPNGPSAKFHVLNVHTMDELKLTGNSMLGSRPLLNFDAKFNQTPHWQVVKGILMDIFNTPRGHPKSKPFIDRVMSFFVADGKVWVRNYQIVDKGDGSSTALNRRIERAGNGAAGGGGGGGEATGTEDPLSLVEMGPRFVLNPIRVFAGSFGGPTLYANAAYVSPNDVRSARKRKAGNKFEDRQDAKKIIRGKKAEPAVPRGPLDDVFSG
ncbi:unnamed protein product [Pylaiella littoralis]